jgi:hypothetical protein
MAYKEKKKPRHTSEKHTKEFNERRHKLWELQHKCRTPSGFEGMCIAPFLHCPPNHRPQCNIDILETLTFYMNMKDNKNPLCSLFVDGILFSHYNSTLPPSIYEVKSKVAIEKGQVITYVVGKLMIGDAQIDDSQLEKTMIEDDPWPIYKCRCYQETTDRMYIFTSPVVYDSGFYSACIHRNQVNKIKDKIAQFRAEPNYSRFIKSTSDGNKANALALMNGNGNGNIEIRAFRNIALGEVIICYSGPDGNNSLNCVHLLDDSNRNIFKCKSLIKRSDEDIQRCYNAAIEIKQPLKMASYSVSDAERDNEQQDCLDEDRSTHSKLFEDTGMHYLTQNSQRNETLEVTENILTTEIQSSKYPLLSNSDSTEAELKIWMKKYKATVGRHFKEDVKPIEYEDNGLAVLAVDGLTISEYAKLYSDAGICFKFRLMSMKRTRDRFNKFFECAQIHKGIYELDRINREEMLDKRVNLADKIWERENNRTKTSTTSKSSQNKDDGR